MNSSKNIYDNFPREMGLSIMAIEFMIIPILAGFVVGFYNGVEINHPGQNSFHF